MRFFATWAAMWAIALLIASVPAHDVRGAAPLERDASALPAIGPGTSLLVISPHPDDETLCCGGVIQRVGHAGGLVTIVWLTSGDAARMNLMLMSHSLLPGPAVGRALGAQRMGEARSAAARLGVSAQRQLFLGYPDGGLLELLGGPPPSAHTPSTTRALPQPH